MKENTRREVLQIMKCMYVLEKTLKRCTGFSYIGPKLYNMIPKDIKEAKMTSKPSERDRYGRTSTNHLTVIKIDKDLYIYMCIAV